MIRALIALSLLTLAAPAWAAPASPEDPAGLPLRPAAAPAHDEAPSKERNDPLFDVALGGTVDRLLMFSPGLMAGTDAELCSEYGFCVYSMPDPGAMGLAYLNVTVFDGVVIGANAAASISRLENPPCDAYAALVKRYGPPLSEKISQAIRAQDKVNFSGGRGLVETPYDPARFRDECSRCVLKNSAGSVYLLDLRFAGELAVTVTPDAIIYRLGEESAAMDALAQARKLRDGKCDEECMARRKAAADSLEDLGLTVIKP